MDEKTLQSGTKLAEHHAGASQAADSQRWHLGNSLPSDQGTFSGYIDFDPEPEKYPRFDLCYFLAGLFCRPGRKLGMEEISNGMM